MSSFGNNAERRQNESFRSAEVIEGRYGHVHLRAEIRRTEIQAKVGERVDTRSVTHDHMI